jgi:hypothetical protein
MPEHDARAKLTELLDMIPEPDFTANDFEDWNEERDILHETLATLLLRYLVPLHHPVSEDDLIKGTIDAVTRFTHAVTEEEN